MAKPEEPVKDEGARSFSRFFERVAEGNAEAEASKKLNHLCSVIAQRAKLTTGKAKGELEVKLKITIDSEGQAFIDFAIKAKEPEPPRRQGVMWLTKGGNLVPRNPRQQELEYGHVREVPPQAPARDLDEEDISARDAE